MPATDTDESYGKRMPAIFYFRERPCEPALSTAGMRQQLDLASNEARYCSVLIGMFVERELAVGNEPESRPALKQAIEAAITFASNGGMCEIIVLRVDPIGSGRALLMNSTVLESIPLPEQVHVRYLGCAGFEAQLYQEWLEATGGDEEV